MSSHWPAYLVLGNGALCLLVSLGAHLNDVEGFRGYTPMFRFCLYGLPIVALLHLIAGVAMLRGIF